MQIICVEGFVWLVERRNRCTYAFVWNSRLKLMNRFHWTINFFSLVLDMKAVCLLCSSEINIGFICSGHSLSSCSNQACPVRHSRLLISPKLIIISDVDRIVATTHMIQLWNDTCIQYLSDSVGYKHLLFAMRSVFPLKDRIRVCPKVTVLKLWFVFF